VITRNSRWPSRMPPWWDLALAEQLSTTRCASQVRRSSLRNARHLNRPRATISTVWLWRKSSDRPVLQEKSVVDISMALNLLFQSPPAYLILEPNRDILFLEMCSLCLSPRQCSFPPPLLRVLYYFVQLKGRTAQGEERQKQTQPVR